MMKFDLNLDVATLLLVVGLASVVVYRSNFFHKRKLFQLSLVQLFYLVVVPGLTAPLMFRYVRSVMAQPVSQHFLSDGVLVMLLVMALFFGYGGVCIHAVTKMIAEELRSKGQLLEDSELAALNRHFHLTFSHN